MSAPIDITVYIASHNYGSYLQTAIESVLRQTVDGWELLVINDNSTDNTEEVMDLYCGDPRVRCFTTGGIGLPAVCNLALREARGRYLIRLDGDDIFDENILLVLKNYLDRHQECAMVFPDFFLIDNSGQVFAQERREKVYLMNHMLDVPANGACCMIRGQVLRDIGGYREDLGAQDGFDLWNKLIEKHRCGNVNVPLFYYRKHDNNLTRNVKHILQARRQIKWDSIRDRLDHCRPISAVIPCRRHYDFLPDLWNVSLGPKTLLEKEIEKCTRSDVFDHIIVASDNPTVQDIMARYDDPRLTFHERRTEDTVRSVPLTSMLDPLLQRIDPALSGITVISYLQAPFVRTETMEEAVATLVGNNADSAFGAEEITSPLFKRSPHGLVPINPPRGFISDFDIVYREVNTAWAIRNVNIRNGSMMGASVLHFLVSGRENFFIRSPHTLKVAQALVED